MPSIEYGVMWLWSANCVSSIASILVDIVLELDSVKLDMVPSYILEDCDLYVNNLVIEDCLKLSGLRQEFCDGEYRVIFRVVPL